VPGADGSVLEEGGLTARGTRPRRPQLLRGLLPARKFCG